MAVFFCCVCLFIRISAHKRIVVDAGVVGDPCVSIHQKERNRLGGDAPRLDLFDYFVLEAVSCMEFRLICTCLLLILTLSIIHLGLISIYNV